jgi:hypothetical protein
MDDKRHKEDPVPSNLDLFLNQMQMMTLHKIEEFGWHLWFVRRPLFQEAMAVVTDSANSVTAILESDGTMNKNHGMVFRPQ